MDEKVRVGELIEGTIATVRENASAAGIYIVVLSVLATALEWGLGAALEGSDPLVDLSGPVMAYLGVGAGIGGLLVLIVAVVSQYLLWEAMLENGALMVRGRAPRRYLAFVGLAILSGLGTGLAFLALVVPGLIVLARWVAAPAYLIRQRMGVIEAMRQSWYAVKGITTPIVFTFLIGVFAVSVLGGLVGVGAFVTMADGGQPGFLAVLGNQLLSNASSVLQVAFGVFVFRRLTGDVNELGAVFE
ncbi:hypothetical protein [Alteraurantiacibacter buctensis]|uniref:Glycerophosphoryl diester phosphodiesterase membrane domain-containing protein n=1 Tax=Alteraurantiacibacter buctensis TaxID=1503981 RepID=A0A844Z0B2_9SPHN|nr:hypothetical protein [Alteraurantiacibacter buctensis]MXO72431.1 hypothetical protein [Alteraurantiacibacter buctensis]